MGSVLSRRVRGQKSEVRGQRTEDRGQKALVREPDSEAVFISVL